MAVIPAKAGIRTLRKTWIPGQALPAIAGPLSPNLLRIQQARQAGRNDVKPLSCKNHVNPR